MYIQRLFKKPPTRIAALYIIMASAWILLSDTVLYSLGVSAVTPAASMMKGIAFVAVTATILYLYSRREFRLRFRIEAELHAQIADARRSQAALEQSEARFRKAIEEAPLPIMMFAEDGDILTISQTWLDITGYTRDQLRTIPAWTELAYGERKEQVLAVIDRLFDSDSRVDQGEFTITCTDGTHRVWEFSSTPLGRLPDKRRIAVSIAADVTARKQTGEVLQTIFDNIPAMISLVDQEGRFRMVNQHWIDVLGWTLAEMEAYPDVMAVFYPDPADRQAALNHIQAADRTWRDFQTVTKDGQMVDTSWANVRLSDGQTVGIGKDITERKQLENTLRESEERLSLFIEHAPASLAMFDQKMRYLAVSRRWMTDYNLSEGDIIGRSHYEIFPEISERWKAAHQLGLAGEVVKTEEDEFKRADGSIQWLHWEIYPWHINNGAIGGIIIFTEDITERKQLENTLRESEERYRLLVESSPYAIAVHQDGALVFVNHAAVHLMRVTHPADLLGKPISDIVHPDTRPAAVNRIQRMLAGETGLYPVDDRYVRPDGSVVDVEVTAAPFTFNGRPAIQVIALDITEKKHLEDELRESELRFRRAMENIPDVVVLYDHDLRIQYINSAAPRIMGRPVSDFIGRREDEIWPPEIYEAYQPILTGAFETGQTQTIETELHLPGGRIRTLVITCVPLTDESGTVREVMGITHDLTERKRMENAIRESETRFRQIAEAIHEVFFLRDVKKHSMLYVSPAYEDIWGRTRENVYQDSGSFLDAIHPDDRARVVAGMEVQREGQGVEAVYRIIRPDHKIRWIRSRTFPVFDTHGILSRIAGVASDITEQVRYENQLKRLSQRLVTVLDNERARIARELHDQVGQQLTGLGINLSVVAMQCTQDNQAIPLLKESTELTSQIIERIRYIIADLRPFVLDDMGLAAGLGWYCQSFARRTGIVVHFNDATESTQLSPETNNTLYQIAQETLTNVAKHAQATQVWITLELTGNQLKMYIRDDGTGFDVQSVMAGNSVGHWGIQIMHERVQALVGASLHIKSTPGEGAMVLVEVQL